MNTPPTPSTPPESERLRVGDIVNCLGVGDEWEVTSVKPDDFSEDPCGTLIETKCIKVGDSQRDGEAREVWEKVGMTDLTMEDDRDLIRRPTK